MPYKYFRRLAVASLCIGFVGLAGCAETEPYDVEKPVIEDEQLDEGMDRDFGTIDEETEETPADGSDAVMPNRDATDADTRPGVLNVDEDPTSDEPATGGANADADRQGTANQ